METFRKILKARGSTKKGPSGPKNFYDYQKYKTLTRLEKEESDQEYVEEEKIDQNESSDHDDVQVKVKPRKRKKKKSSQSTPPKKAKTDPPILKRLDELNSPKQLSRRTQKVFDELIELSEKDGMEFGKLLGYLGRRYYSNEHNPSRFNKQKAQIFDDIYQEKDPYEMKKLTPKQGVYLKKQLDIGRRRYVNLRKFLDPYVHLPNSDESMKMKLSQVLFLCLMEFGGLYPN